MAMFYKIALFIFLFNISLAMLNEINIYPEHQNIEPTDWVNSTVDKVNTTFNPYQVVGLDILGPTMAGIGLFIGVLYGSIAVFPLFYQAFGCNPGIACDPMVHLVVFYMTAAIWFIYGTGIFQFVSGRQIKTME